MKYSHAITAVWILCVIAAFTVINQYSTTAGVNSGLTRIPAGTAFEPQDKPRLLVFLHLKHSAGSDRQRRAVPRLIGSLAEDQVPAGHAVGRKMGRLYDESARDQSLPAPPGLPP